MMSLTQGFNLQDKVALVTGATFGIGKETALGLAKQRAHVVIVGRNRERTLKTVLWLKKQSGHDKIDFFISDLSELSQVKALSKDFRSQFNRLDILINNAGAIFTKRQLNSENLEKTWVLNHLSPLLLTLELRDMLRASAPARVINVASGMYVDGNIDINSWDNEKKYSATGSYSDSKMAMVLSTFVLAGLFENEGITVNTLHPGFVTTGMGTNNRDLYGLLIRALAPLKWIIRSTTKYMISPVEGAKTSIYLASSPNVSKVTGKYFYKNKERRTTEKTLDANFQKKVWEFSMRQIRTALGDQSIGGDISNW